MITRRFGLNFILVFSVTTLLSLFSCGDRKADVVVSKREREKYFKRINDSIVEAVYSDKVRDLVVRHGADSLLNKRMLTYQFQEFVSNLSTPVFFEGRVLDVALIDSMYHIQLTELESLDILFREPMGRFSDFGEFFEYPRRYFVAEIAMDSTQFSVIRNSLQSPYFSGTIGAVFNVRDYKLSDALDVSNSYNNDGTEMEAHKEYIKRVLLKGRMIDCCLKRGALEADIY
ncbi:MAG: hypothetical protein ACK5W1_10490 [Flavobacteriales bacterium]